jgi:glutaredoxin
MPNITLLYSPTCGACPSAKSLWKELRVKYSFSYREVDITTPNGQELADRHAIRAVPATIIDGKLTFIGVPSRQSAEKALQLKIQRQQQT